MARRQLGGSHGAGRRRALREPQAAAVRAYRYRNRLSSG